MKRLINKLLFMDAPNIGKNGSNLREATAVVTEKGITQTPRVKR